MGVAVAILVGSVLPVPPSDSQTLIPFADKVLHVVAYGGLAFGLGRAIDVDGRLPPGVAIPRSVGRVLGTPVALAIGVIGVTVTYGIGIEGLQLLVPGRQFELADGLANGVGAILGVAFWTALPPRGGPEGVSPSGGASDLPE